MRQNLLRRTRRLSLTLSGLLILTSETRASRVVAGTAETVEAKKGDIASGTIATETAKELRLKTEPCSTKTTVVVFYPPFTKTKIGTIKCGTTLLDRYQVEKK